MEYAKSSRSKCRMCFEPIAQDELRVGALRPTDHDRGAFAGDVPHWCHRKCFVELLKTDDYEVRPCFIEVFNLLLYFLRGIDTCENKSAGVPFSVSFHTHTHTSHATMQT